jgi:hypothetical protein
MNKRLPEEIFNIVKKLDKIERKSFESYSLKKSPEDGKEHKYIKLFKLYLKQVGELDLDEAILKKEAKTISTSINDLHQKLHEELLKFLGQSFREKNTDRVDKIIDDQLDISIALYEKRLFALSAKTFLSAIKLLKEVQDLNMKEHLLYVSLKAYSWIYSIKYRAKLTKEEEYEFDAFHEYIRPFSQIARNSYAALTEVKKEDSLNNENFNKATFYSLLNIYFRERKDFESMFSQRGNDQLFSISALVKGRYKNYGNQDSIAEQAEDSIIDAESFYFQLERLYRAVLVNDSIEFDQSFNSIRNKLFPHFSLGKFNADLLLFVYRQLFELKTIFTLQNNQEPFDIHGLRELETFSRSKSQLFHDSEIGDLNVRLELNSFVILFLENNFSELHKRINAFEKSNKKDIYKDYFIDIKLMGIISRMESGGAADEDLDARIDYYENYTKKYPTSSFHKKFDGFVKAFLKAGTNERKKVCQKYLSKLENSKETFNHFHALFLQWVKKHC